MNTINTNSFDIDSVIRNKDHIRLMRSSKIWKKALDYNYEHDDIAQECALALYKASLGKSQYDPSRSSKSRYIVLVCSSAIVKMITKATGQSKGVRKCDVLIPAVRRSRPTKCEDINFNNESLPEGIVESDIMKRIESKHMPKKDRKDVLLMLKTMDTSLISKKDRFRISSLLKSSIR